ncbi:MAG TPA: response regulator [Pseudobacteroides sp.]|uniref:response regulator n=1 Tax=Pseudobacteroides sp. TaxID=1968840 RepID=UPI002F91F7C5
MKKVLIVDDTKNIRELLTKCLKIEGYDVKTANDGNGAMEIFLQEAFDLAFLDIKMPHLSGTEVLKKIREIGIKTPVIIITAYATVKNAFECTHMGAVAYLQKPFTPEKIRNVLSDLNEGNTVGEEESYSDFLTNAHKLIQDNLFSEAVYLLKKALSENPLDAEVYLLLSKANKGLGFNIDAEKYFKIYEIIK